MSKLILRLSTHLPGLVICLVLLSGCMPGSNSKASAPLSSEEAYIDLKHSFSIVLPVTWKRVRTPVSSPAYRPGMVEWEIASQTGAKNRLQILQVPLTDQKTALSHYLSIPEVAVSNQTKTLNFPFGPALSLEVITDSKKSIYIATSDEVHTYILSFQINQNDYTSLEPAILNAIKSFDSLQ